jgi:LuxR family maltose regulon positive regulatory protein
MGRQYRGVAWLSLDRQDNDPMRFWRYLVSALDRVCGGLAEQVLPDITPPNVVDGRGIVTSLVNQLQPSPEPLALAIDDYHVIDSRPIHEGMTLLLDNLPPQLRLVISSRSDPRSLVQRSSAP